MKELAGLATLTYRERTIMFRIESVHMDFYKQDNYFGGDFVNFNSDGGHMTIHGDLAHELWDWYKKHMAGNENIINFNELVRKP